ncbi:C40 family peptidase [Arthrobacter oryzae]|uniref:Cell wall-associated NlpC family hydrolase n=1 Tax=Arthrobacter oryzae TaxID=409290 RepID=A0A495E9L8_9MICC|nr:C40 family peptidase [Arthrobacter oryzae]RKR13610.1 cell wall-associated NlpC family hydrolase [Arthrobacter oryzae]
MSMTEAIGRMQGIQSMIAELTRPAATETSAAAAKASAASSLATATGAGDSSSFTQALATALGGTGTAGAASLTDSSGLGASLGLGSTTAAGATGLSGLAGLTGVGGLTGLAGLAGLTAAQAPGTIHTGAAATGNDVVAVAKKYIGVPYVWGGTNPATGMDCSGFTQRVFKDLGVEIPRVVSDQMRQGTPVASLAEAKPGDLLVSFGGNHISIYLGNGKAIDAPVPGKTIQIRDAWEQQSNLTAIRRIVPAGAAS